MFFLLSMGMNRICNILGMLQLFILEQTMSTLGNQLPCKNEKFRSSVWTRYNLTESHSLIARHSSKTQQDKERWIYPETQEFFFFFFLKRCYLSSLSFVHNQAWDTTVNCNTALTNQGIFFSTYGFKEFSFGRQSLQNLSPYIFVTLSSKISRTPSFQHWTFISSTVIGIRELVTEKQ